MEPSDYFPGNHFTLAELSITNQAADNSPDPASLSTLTSSALVLEQLRADFGPLIIYSGFRNDLVNNLVGGSPTSDHRLGYAFDLAPSQTSIYAMFNAIVNGPWRNQMREIFLKPSQGALHLSFNTSQGTGKVMLMVSEGNYRPLTQEETDYYLGPVIPDSPLPQTSSTEGVYDPSASNQDVGTETVGAPGLSPILIGALTLAVVAGVYYFTQKEEA